MSEEVEKTKSEEVTGNPLIVAISSLEKWFRRLAAAGVLAFCATLLVAIGLFIYQDDAADAKTETLTTVRDERSIGACKQENQQTLRTREFAKEQLVQVFSIFSRTQLPPEEVRAAREEQFKRYESFVDVSFPYRDCSRDCVIAYLTPEIPDCPTPSDFPD